MTYQPPPPPPGAGGPPAKFDPKTVNPLDWGIIGAGVLAFLLSFISYYSGVTVEFQGREASGGGGFSAWNDIIGGGFFNWFAMLLAVVGAGVVALSLFAPQVRLPLSNRLLGLGAFALATLFIIIGIFVTPSADEGDLGLLRGDYDVSADHGFGFWVSFIVIIAGLALSLVRFQSTGGQLPGGLQGRVPNVAGYDKQGGVNPGGQPPHVGPGNQPPPPPPAGGTPPPPPGYGPPQ